MKSVDLGLLDQKIQKMVEERDWDQFHSIKNLSMALTVETAELLELFQWLTEDQTNQIQNDPKLLKKAEDELADIFIYLLRILKKTNIDIEQAVLAKMKRNEEKYPIDRSKGSAKKYTDL